LLLLSLLPDARIETPELFLAGCLGDFTSLLLHPWSILWQSLSLRSQWRAGTLWSGEVSFWQWFCFAKHIVTMSRSASFSCQKREPG